jgi:hypothetical protein
MKPVTPKREISRSDLFEPLGKEPARTQPSKDVAVDHFSQSTAVRDAHIDTVERLSTESIKRTGRHAAVCSKISLLEKERAQLEEEIAAIDEQMLKHGREAASLTSSELK